MERESKPPRVYRGGAVLCCIEVPDDEIALPIFKITIMHNGTACSRAMFVNDIKLSKNAHSMIHDHLDTMRDSIRLKEVFPSSIYNVMCEVVWDYIEYFRAMNEL